MHSVYGMNFDVTANRELY